MATARDGAATSSVGHWRGIALAGVALLVGAAALSVLLRSGDPDGTAAPPVPLPERPASDRAPGPSERHPPLPAAPARPEEESVETRSRGALAAEPSQDPHPKGANRVLAIQRRGPMGGAFRSGEGRPDIPPRPFENVTVKKLGHETPAFLAVVKDLDRVLSRENELELHLEFRMARLETVKEALAAFRQDLEHAAGSTLSKEQREEVARFMEGHYRRLKEAQATSLDATGFEASPWLPRDGRGWRERPEVFALAVEQRRGLGERLAELKRERDAFVGRLLAASQWERYREYRKKNKTSVGLSL